MCRNWVYESAVSSHCATCSPWAYKRSCEQYRITREALGEPDPIRLLYRAQLGEVVRESVLELRPPQRADVRAWTETHEVPAADLDAFTNTALGLLIDLHEGALARYGLRPSDFTRWREAIAHAEPFARTKAG